MTYIAYLAGPITGVSYGESVDWREWFIKNLPPEIQGMSPMRGKAYLQMEREIKCSYPNEVMSCDRGIMTRDYNDCQRADVLVVNLLGATKVSIGTVMEIAWAYTERIPVILVIEPTGNPHDHSMIREAVGFRVSTLDEALTVTKAVLLPIPHQ